MKKRRDLGSTCWLVLWPWASQLWIVIANIFRTLRAVCYSNTWKALFHFILLTITIPISQMRKQHLNNMSSEPCPSGQLLFVVFDPWFHKCCASDERTSWNSFIIGQMDRALGCVDSGFVAFKVGSPTLKNSVSSLVYCTCFSLLGNTLPQS